MMVERLFVYGTLKPGECNHHLVSGIAGQWQAASLRGRLFPDGMGRAAGYPALEADPEGDTVVGWLLSSDALNTHWARLDEFEGDAYCRTVVAVRTADGAEVMANVYFLAGPLPVEEARQDHGE